MAQTSAKELKARRMGVFSLNSPWDPEKVDSRGAVMPKSGEQVPVDLSGRTGGRAELCPGLPQGCRASRAQESGGSWKAGEMKGIKCQKARSSPTCLSEKREAGRRDCSQLKGRLHAASVLSDSSASCGPQQSRSKTPPC